jgi:hypothetical protein
MPMRAASCSRNSEYATAVGLVTSAISPLDRVDRLFNRQAALPANGADHECATLIRGDFDFEGPMIDARIEPIGPSNSKPHPKHDFASAPPRPKVKSEPA